MTFLVQLQAWGPTVLNENELHHRKFLAKFVEFSEHIFTFAEDCWATASDSQQYFESIACCIKNKSIQSQLTVWRFQKPLFAEIQSIFSEDFIVYYQKLTKVKGKILWLMLTQLIKSIW